MKISIEIELTPEEIPLADKTLKLLESLDSQFKEVISVKKDVILDFSEILKKLKDRTNLDEVIEEILAIIETCSEESRAAKMDDLYKELNDNILNKKKNSEEMVLNLEVLKIIDEKFNGNLKLKLLKMITNELMVKRGDVYPLEDVMVYCEALARLVQLEMLLETRAVTMIIKILTKREFQVAAVLCLQKLVTYCSNKLLTKCEKKDLDSLQSNLRLVKNQNCSDLINQICLNMQWDPIIIISANGNIKEGSINEKNQLELPSVQLNGFNYILKHEKTWNGHKNHILSLSYNYKTKTIASGEKQGGLIIWNDKGEITNQFELPNYHICCIDFNYEYNFLFLTGISSEFKKKPPYFSIFDINTAWTRNDIVRDGHSIISCLKTIDWNGDEGFVTGEEVSLVKPFEERVCYYDLNSASNLKDIKPEISFKGHQDIITSVSASSSKPMLLFSSSKDHTIKVWDRRTRECIGNFGTINYANRICAHNSSVTCIDIRGNDLVSAGEDGILCHWDLRKLHNQSYNDISDNSNYYNQKLLPINRIKLGKNMVLKLAMENAPIDSLVAATDLACLYIINLKETSGNWIKTYCTKRKYFDAKWAKDTNLLYTSAEKSIEIFSIT